MRGPHRVRAGLGALTLAAAFVAFLLLVPGGPGVGAAGEGSPFGGGILFVDQQEQMVAYRFRTGADGGIRVEKVDSVLTEAGIHFRGPPFRSESGDWWLPAAGTRVLGEDPDAWLVTRDSTRRVYATDGDDNVLQIAPDGRHYLLSVQDPDTSWFRMNLVRFDPVTGDTAVVAAAAGNGSWSPDGSLVLVHPRAGGADSMVTMRPDGTPVAGAPVPAGFGSARAWCGGAGPLVGTSLPPARGPEVWIWRLEEQAPEPLELVVPFSRGLACSPRGREVAYFGRADGGTVLVVHDRVSGEVHTFDDVPGPTALHWVPRTPPDAPRAVDVARDVVELVRGARTGLEYDVVGTSGALPAERRTWTSSDPLVAVVHGDGRVVGNGPGEATVTLRVDGWLSDSVSVRVTEREDSGGPAFVDRLAELDRDGWYTVGFPTPVPDTLDDGQVVLSMEGDGSYRDGIVTRRRFDVGRGATLEVDFRLPLTRPDRQQMELCLMDGEPGSDPAAWDLWMVDESVCFQWPARELERFDPGEAGFAAATLRMGPVRVDGLVREDDWNRATIQLRPDGAATLFLNGTEVATLWDRIPLGPGEQWRLAVFGRAADTKLHVRNLVLWGEARAGAPAG